ncbi:MAG: hypothetical protein HRT71_17200 [Flavobacteriales bacterium]|nr:hypothetical protein [Flavobacteriales bacterium]
MRKSVNIICVAVALMTVLYSCSDIIEKDISEESVFLNAPAEGLELEDLTQTYWWDEVAGASYYNLQIVSPSFASAATVLLDTNVTSNKFTYTLSSGDYQWRVRAENSTSESNYTTHNISFSDDIDLNAVTINLTSPNPGELTNDTVIEFVWDEVGIAHAYRIQILYPNVIDPTYEELDTLIYTNSYTHTFVADGSFEWQVMGVDTATQMRSLYSYESITVDATIPTKPNNGEPESADMIKLDSAFTFSWDQGTDALSGIMVDTVFVYSNASLKTQVAALVGNESAASPDWDKMSVNNTYWWVVQSTDYAENQSSFSDTTSFIVY